MITEALESLQEHYGNLEKKQLPIIRFFKIPEKTTEDLQLSIFFF